MNTCKQLKNVSAAEILERLQNGETVKFVNLMCPSHVALELSIIDDQFVSGGEPIGEIGVMAPGKISCLGVHTLRNGDRVYVSKIDKRSKVKFPVHGIMRGKAEADKWDITGKYASAGKGPHDFDIVDFEEL